MHPHKIAENELKEAGYDVKRITGGHAIYFNPETKTTIVLKTHDFNDNDLKYIRKEIKQAKNNQQ